MKSKKLEDKVCIVTGASRGIGKAIALALADEAAIVVVVARTIEEGGPLKGTIFKTTDEIKARGGQVLPIQADVADEIMAGNMVEETLKEFGHIDILVNNAGTNIPRYFKDSKLKHWDIVMRATLRSMIVCSKEVLPQMINQGYGSIINISSLAAVAVSTPLTGLAYDVCKAGINRFTWGLAEELKKYNIAVNALMPNNTITEGWSMLNPDVDKSKWQTPELWGKITTFVATRDPATFTGKILDEDDVKKEMVAAGWDQ